MSEMRPEWCWVRSIHEADTTPVQSGDKFHLGFKDGTAIEYDREAHVFALTFEDTTAFKYDSEAHLLTLNFEDQASIKYDASAHSLALDFNDGTRSELQRLAITP